MYKTFFWEEGANYFRLHSKFNGFYFVCFLFVCLFVCFLIRVDYNLIHTTNIAENRHSPFYKGVSSDFLAVPNFSTDTSS